MEGYLKKIQENNALRVLWLFFILNHSLGLYVTNNNYFIKITKKGHKRNKYVPVNREKTDGQLDMGWNSESVNSFDQAHPPCTPFFHRTQTKCLSNCFLAWQYKKITLELESKVQIQSLQFLTYLRCK